MDTKFILLSWALIGVISAQYSLTFGGYNNPFFDSGDDYSPYWSGSPRGYNPYFGDSSAAYNPYFLNLEWYNGFFNPYQNYGYPSAMNDLYSSGVNQNGYNGYPDNNIFDYNNAYYRKK